MMKKILMMAFAWCFALTMGAQLPTSPNGRLSVSTADKGLSVCYRQQQVRLPNWVMKGSHSIWNCNMPEK